MTLVRLARLVVFMGAALGVWATTALSAYGPVLPPGAVSAGGFTTILTGLTLGPKGGALAADSCKCDVRVSVSRGTFRVPLQVTLTAPNLPRVQSLLDSSRLRGFRAVCGVGIGARRTDGAEVRGRLGPALAVLSFFHLPRDRPKMLLRWNNVSGEYQIVGRAGVAAGSATVRFRRARAFVAVVPKR